MRCKIHCHLTSAVSCVLFFESFNFQPASSFKTYKVEWHSTCICRAVSVHENAKCNEMDNQILKCGLSAPILAEHMFHSYEDSNFEMMQGLCMLYISELCPWDAYKNVFTGMKFELRSMNRTSPDVLIHSPLICHSGLCVIIVMMMLLCSEWMLLNHLWERDAEDVHVWIVGSLLLAWDLNRKSDQ